MVGPEFFLPNLDLWDALLISVVYVLAVMGGVLFACMFE